jgi:signal transduction histidine kinase
VRDVARAFAPLAHQAGMTIAVEAPAAVPARLDRAALRRALVNLLDNAVKYGPRGQTITVRLTEGNGRACLRVEDEGPGVPPDRCAWIWHPFSRLDRAIDRAVPGTGLGLSIVRDAAAALGGEATVEANAAGGARFVIVLPTHAPPPLAATA